MTDEHITPSIEKISPIILIREHELNGIAESALTIYFIGTRKYVSCKM